MPFYIVDERARFEFTLEPIEAPAALPVAPIVQWGAALYTRCCPLCGCCHEILKMPADGIYQPRCIVKTTHPHVYAAWIEKYPDAANYTRVMLTGREAIRIVETPARPAKRERRAA